VLQGCLWKDLSLKLSFVPAFTNLISIGGSAVDHMMFDRGSADDYENWEKLQNPGWGWKDLLPYFQKVRRSTFFEVPR